MTIARNHTFRLRPAHLNRYRRVIDVLVRHGFGALLAGLRLGNVLNLPERLFRQETKQLLTPAAHLRQACEDLGGTYVKLGQMLSTRPDLLPVTYIKELSRLQDQASKVPWEDIRVVLEQELGAPIKEVFDSIDSEPLASASLGQVHAASVMKDNLRTDVVVKVQRPGVERTVQLDLDILYDLAWRFQNHPELAQFIDPVEVVEEFSATITNELDYQREAHAARRFRDNFREDPEVCIPRVTWSLSSRRVLVMERLYGAKVSDLEAIKAAGLSRKSIAASLAGLYIKSIYEDRFFHADPHPGNIWVLDDGRLALLDFGRVGSISKRDEVQLFALVKAIVAQDARATAESLMRIEDVAQKKISVGALERDINRVLDKFAGRPLNELQLGSVLQEVMHLASRHHLRLPSNWVILLQTMAMLEGVLAMLDPDFDIFSMSRPYIVRLQQEQLLPAVWGPPLVQASSDWLSLWKHFPKHSMKLMRQAEQGDLEMELKMPDIKRASESLDRAANRLSVSLLVASLIVAIGFVIPLLDLNRPWNVMTWLAIVGFISVFVLGLWLVLSIWRVNHPKK